MVGEFVGSGVVGGVGEFVGIGVVGAAVVGESVGTGVVGVDIGEFVGLAVVGPVMIVGDPVGNGVGSTGEPVGAIDGAKVDSHNVKVGGNEQVNDPVE